MSIAKHLLNIVLVLAMLFGSLRISFTYVYYYLDPAGFTEKLCENKDRPELECNGKCYLMKIAVPDNQENKTTLPEIEYKDLQLFFEGAPNTENAAMKSATLVPDMYDNRYKYLLESKLFHPPKQVI